ncbi:MAG: DUF1015 family protein [Candidatus Eremiobacterota bacterium]
MADFLPLRGYRFRGDIGPALAPPRDTLSRNELDRLRQAPVQAAHLMQEPALARAVLDRWLSEGVLTRDPDPCYYVVQHEFRSGEESLVRTGVVGLLPPGPLGDGLLPHQRTLRRTVEADLVYLRRVRLYLDMPVLLSRTSYQDLEALTAGPPDFEGLDPGSVLHRVWRVPTLGALFRDEPLVVLEGHQWVETVHHHGLVRPACRLPAVVYPADDPGLLVICYHRGVRGLPPEALEGLLERLSGTFGVSRWRQSVPELLGEMARRPGSLGMARGSELFLLELPAGEPRSVVLHRAILEDLFGLTEERIRSERVLEYLTDADRAMGELESGHLQLVFFLTPLEPESVMELAEQERLIPSHTTTLLPRPPCGLIFHCDEPG